MEKLIFFTLAIPILLYIFFLGGTAIMKGFNAKTANRTDNNKNDLNENYSNELIKLNELYEKGALTKDEFEKAKKKFLNI
jgi:hypothetical protein